MIIRARIYMGYQGTKTIDRKAIGRRTIGRRLLVEKTIGQKRLLVETRQLVEIFFLRIPGLAVPNSGKFRVCTYFKLSYGITKKSFEKIQL